MDVHVMKLKIVSVIIIFGFGLVITGCSFSSNEPPPLIFPTLIRTGSPVIVEEEATQRPAQTLVPVRTPTPQIEPTNMPTQPEYIPVVKFRPGRQATATRLVSPPVIDGVLSEWIGKEGFTVSDVVYGEEEFTGSNDLSGLFWLGWDTENFYIAASVRDDVYVQNASGIQLYLGDSLEFQLDTLLENDFASQEMSFDDYQVGISVGADLDKGSHKEEVYLWMPIEKRASILSAHVFTRLIEGGYELEAAIPWSTLGVEPKEGMVMGFTVSISDNDTPGTQDQQTMVSMANTRKLTDPTSWGSLILGK